jgi:hypothetical protein
MPQKHIESKPAPLGPSNTGEFMKTPILQSRTFWAALATLIIGIIRAVGVDEKWIEIVNYAVAFATVVFLRDAIPAPEEGQG